MNKTVTTLNLSNNLISDKGALYLASVIVQNDLVIGTTDLVDGDGNLTGSNRTNFLGTHGNEVSF